MMGSLSQYTSDTTKHCHHTHVKTPYCHSNKKNFHKQCSHFMDWVEKISLFNFYVSLKISGASLVNDMIDEASNMADHYPESTWLSQVLPPGDVAIGHSVPQPSLFHKTQSHLSDNHVAAFMVNLKPHCKITVQAAATLFGLPNFQGALGDFFVLKQTYAECHGQRKSSPSVGLPFTHVHIWHSFRMQQCSAQDETIILPSCTVQALPPPPCPSDGATLCLSMT